MKNEHFDLLRLRSVTITQCGKLRIIGLFVAFGLSLNLGAQTLGETLWLKTKNCHQYFEDMDDDGEPDFDKVDDAKNGYLHVSGEWPTCGCGCDATIAAFKDAKGQYTYIQEQIWNCDWIHETKASRKIEEVFPANFGFHSFTGESKKYTASEAHFIVDPTIPQHGTDMKVEIKIVPFGLPVKYSDPLAYVHKQPENPGNLKSLYALEFIAKRVKDPQVFDHVRKGEYDKITAEDQKIIDDEIGDSWGKFKDMDDLKAQVVKVYKVYEMAKKIKYQALVLGWDKAKGRFYIKSKEDNKIKYSSFLDFMKKAAYWAMLC